MSNDFPIAIVEPRGAVCVLTSEGGHLVRTEIARSGFQPLWNPVRAELAVPTLGEGGASSSVELYDTNGEHLRTLHSSIPGQPPAIGPRLPQYLSWSPRGDHLAIVAPGSDRFSLFLSDAGGALLSDPVVSGAPLFPAWSPDGKYLAVHSAGELSIVDAEAGRAVQVIGGNVAGFRTPAYSSDGSRLAYASANESGISVFCTNPDGSDGKETGSFAGGVALAFRPGTHDLTVAVTRVPDTGNFDELWSLELESGRRTRLLRGPFVSYSWSPRGDRFVTVVPAQTGDGRFLLRAHLPDGSPCAAAEPFVPSVDYRTMLGFFDQYGTSHRQWAPDGSSLVVTGRLADDTVSASFGDPSGPYVMRWTAERAAPLELLAPADFAAYPPNLRDSYV